MTRILALAVASFALLAAPAYAQQVSFSAADCNQSVEDLKELFASESTDEGTEQTVTDILANSAVHCAQAEYAQADELMRGARIMLATE